MSNPRYANGWKRRKARATIKARREPCGICGKPIDYGLGAYVDPKDGKVKRHPFSFEVDEIVPISKGGSPTDLSNLRAVHRICNQRRGNGRNKKAKVRTEAVKPREHSAEW